MSKILKDNVLELLESLSSIYDKQIKYKENMLGMYTKIYLNNEGNDSIEFSHEELEGLNKLEIESLVDFGFKLSGVNTERMYRGSDVFFVDIESRDNNYEDTFRILKKIVTREMNDRYTNYIIIGDSTGDMYINYDLEFVELLEEIQEDYSNMSKLMIMYFNLEGNYLSENHKTDCLRLNNLILDEDIENLEELILKNSEEVIYYNKDVVLSRSSFESLSDERVFRLAYFVLKHKVNLILDSNTMINELIASCRILFSGRYLPVKEGIEFRSTLKNTVVINCVRGRGSMPVVIGGPSKEYKVNCIPMEEIINATDLETLVLMTEPYKLIVNVSEMYDIQEVLDVFTVQYASARKGTPVEIGSLEEARLETLSRLQSVCVRILESNSVSIRNIIAFKRDNKIFLGCIKREDIYNNLEIVRAHSFTNVTNEVYTTSIDIINTLPTQLFLTDRNRNTEYEMPELDIGDLDAIFQKGKGKNSTSSYTSKGEFKRAIYSVRHGIDLESENFYETCLKIDEDLVKGSYIFETGEISIRLRMAP